MVHVKAAAFFRPDAKIGDGIMHYAMITDVSRAMMFRIVPEVMKGTHGRFKQVRMGPVKNSRSRPIAPSISMPMARSSPVPGTDLRKSVLKYCRDALKVVRG